MKPWHIGNTSIRNPYRLQGALTALARSPLNGDLVGKPQESAFAELLHTGEVAFVTRIAEGGTSDYSDFGRKWRSALDQLGFITPSLARREDLDASGRDSLLLSATEDITSLSGRPYEITPNGQRLVRAESTAAIQEVFLRALLSYQIPSVIETRSDVETAFSPLRIVLGLLTGLAEQDLEAQLSYEEFTLFAAFTASEEAITGVIASIDGYRRGRAEAENKRRYYRAVLEERAEASGLKTDTVDTYTNLTLRYLKATGLFASKGRGIVVASEKAQVAAQILEQSFTPVATTDTDAYLKQLWNGATLPTDQPREAAEQIALFAEVITEKRGTAPSLPDVATLSQEDLSVVRLDLEEQVRNLREEDYAARQRNEWQDIHEYMQALVAGKGTKVPSNERPAYLEWTLWRAFLAINSLLNAPWEARQFKVDQDFLPVGTAPGGRPDLVFEFADFVLVVEVTLTSSSRQEAAEGEPVRRHVATYVERHPDKDVYGLFIANNIDSNTAATFAIGRWYLADDSELALSIVPVTLAQFAELFKVGFEAGVLEPEAVRQLLVSALARSNSPAPQWKQEIAREVERAIQRF